MFTLYPDRRCSRCLHLICLYLSFLYSASFRFIFHGFFPADFSRTVPIATQFIVKLMAAHLATGWHPLQKTEYYENSLFTSGCFYFHVQQYVLCSAC